jgi:hypothetical protein
MAINNKEMYHGSVLYHVLNNPDFSIKLIERDKKEHGPGMYEVTGNTKDYVLFIKSRSQIQGTNPLYCAFSFLPNQIDRLRRYKDKELLVCLVCHDSHICALTRREIDELRLLQSSDACNVTVYWQKGSELKVKSKYSTLPWRIPRNRLKTFDW